LGKNKWHLEENNQAENDVLVGKMIGDNIFKNDFSKKKQAGNLLLEQQEMFKRQG